MTYRQTFSTLQEARKWAYRELDVIDETVYLVREEDTQGCDNFYFATTNEYNNFIKYHSKHQVIEIWE